MPPQILLLINPDHGGLCGTGYLPVLSASIPLHPVEGNYDQIT